MMAVASIRMDANELLESLKNVAKNLPKELSIVSSKTAKRTMSFIAKEVTSEVKIPQKVIKRHLTRSKVGKTGYKVDLEKSKRIPLRDFGLKFTKKGASYRIAKAGKRQKVLGAFRFAGTSRNAYIRKDIANNRSGIRPLGRGPSPAGVMSKANFDKVQKISQDTEAEMLKQLKERVRYLRLKKSGAI